MLKLLNQNGSCLDTVSIQEIKLGLQAGVAPEDIIFTPNGVSMEELEEAVAELAKNLCAYNPEAVKEMKQMFWRGTEDWNELLNKRAKISGRLVLSDFTKEKLEKYK